MQSVACMGGDAVTRVQGQRAQLEVVESLDRILAEIMTATHP